MAATAEQSGRPAPRTRTPSRACRSTRSAGLAMDAVQKANAGHPGTAMALAPLAYTIFKRFLRANPDDPEWPDRDRFVLSAGHACMLQYSLLHLTGYDLAHRGPRSSSASGARAPPGTPSAATRRASRSRPARSGQGVANAVGMAMAERFLAERFNRPGQRDRRPPRLRDLLRRRHDGGRSARKPPRSPATSRLGKLIVCYDDNHITIDGTTVDLLRRREPRGAHGGRRLARAARRGLRGRRGARGGPDARRARKRERPVLHRDPLAHRLPGAERGRHRQVARRAARRGGSAPHQGSDGLRPRRALLGRRARLRAHVPGGDAAAPSRSAGPERFQAWREASPEMADDWDLAWSRAAARRLARGAADASQAGEKLATRSAGQKVDGALRRVRADDDRRRRRSRRVDEDACSRAPGEFSRVHAGRNVPFGIREHAMGAIVNGAAAHGGIVKPYGSTFLIFSDYMRGAVRLSALMGLPVLWVWTHDSVGLGEDGPTHQPVEHYAALRAIPHLWVIRPGDANETVAGLAGRARTRGRARSRCCSRARTSRCSTATRSRPPRASSAAATCCGTRPAASPS